MPALQVSPQGLTLAGRCSLPKLAVRLLRLKSPLLDDVRRAAACRGLETALARAIENFCSTAFFKQGSAAAASDAPDAADDADTAAAAARPRHTLVLPASSNVFVAGPHTRPLFSST